MSDYFPTLNLALTKASERRAGTLPGARVWARDIKRYSKKDKAMVLKKDYCVMTTRQMYDLTYRLPESQRVYYEILCDPGDYRDTERHLLYTRIFVDVEYERADNPDYGVPDARLTEIILQSLHEAIARELPDVRVAKIDQLTSGNPNKFSLHLVCFLVKKSGASSSDGGEAAAASSSSSKEAEPEECFLKNAYHVGAFFRKWELWERRHADARPELWVLKTVKNKDAPVKTCVLDGGVYNKRRQFRLAAHTKYGANRFLEFMGSKDIPYEVWTRLLTQDHTRVTPQTPFVTCLERDGTEPGSRSLLYTDEGHSNKRMSAEALLAASTRPGKKARVKSESAQAVDADAPHLKTLARACVAWVRKHTGDQQAAVVKRSDGLSLCVSAPQTTWCNLIEADHHNKVFFIFDFEREVIYERCHSPNCKDLRERKLIFNGESVPDPTAPRIPGYVCPKELLEHARMAIAYRDAVWKYVRLPRKTEDTQRREKGSSAGLTNTH